MGEKDNERGWGKEERDKRKKEVSEKARIINPNVRGERNICRQGKILQIRKSACGMRRTSRNL